MDYGTGLYYLQSRSYNYTTGRFINADGLVSTGQGILGHNMFGYCLNNPVMLVDPTGRCSYLGSINSPKQDCGKRDCPCSQRYSGFLTFCKDFGNRTLQTGEALFNNFEASFGVGLGLQAEFDIIDLLGINLGTHWDLINIALIDGKVQLTQQYESVASLTVAWDEVGAREQRTDTFWEQGTVVSETGRLYNDSLTICSTTAFLIAGISFRIGFDAIHFPEDFDKIWADWWEQYGW